MKTILFFMTLVGVPLASARSLLENAVVGPRASVFVTGKDGEAVDIAAYRRYSRTQTSRKISRSKPDRILRQAPEQLTDYERVLLRLVLRQDMQMDVHGAEQMSELQRERVSPLRLALSDCNAAGELTLIMNDEKADAYKRFNAARGLAYFDDANSTGTLERVLEGEFAQSSSGLELNKAACCLLYVGYDFPEGFSFSQLPNPIFAELDTFLTRHSLPAEYLGAWTFSHSSGGIAGTGDPNYSIDRIEILADNIFKTYREGELVQCTPFVPKKDISFFFPDPVWMITLAGHKEPDVLWITPDGSLHIAANVLDAFEYRYTRIWCTED